MSEANAAERAVNGIEAAIQDAGYSGAIYSDLVIINNDFEYLYEAAMERDSSGISTLLSQINVDSRQLANDCNAG